MKGILVDSNVILDIFLNDHNPNESVEYITICIFSRFLKQNILPTRSDCVYSRVDLFKLLDSKDDTVQIKNPDGIL